MSMYNKAQENDRRARQLSPKKQAEHKVKKCKREVKEARRAIESLTQWKAILALRLDALRDARNERDAFDR